MTGAKITAIGTYVPAKRLTNADLEQIVDTNNEWIVQVIYVQQLCRIL